jgi:hypothetical protein
MNSFYFNLLREIKNKGIKYKIRKTEFIKLRLYRFNFKNNLFLYVQIDVSNEEMFLMKSKSAFAGTDILKRYLTLPLFSYHSYLLLINEIEKIK